MNLVASVIAVFLLCTFSLSLAAQSTVNTQVKPWLDGEKITFRQLPKGEPYKVETPHKTWILSSYEDIARKVVTAMRNELPYDLIKDAIKSKAISDDIIERSIVYELPFVVPGAISLLCGVVIPLTGLIFCCCRFCGRCGGKLEEENMEFSPVKQRHRLSVAIALCSVFILIGSSCVFLSSDRLGITVPLLNTVLEDSINDIITYKNNTIKELEYVTNSEMKFTSTLIAQDLEGISYHVSGPVMVEARKIVHPLLEAVMNTGNIMSKVKALLNNISVTIRELKDLGTELRHQLQEARQNLTEVRAACDADAPAKTAGICDRIPTGGTLVTQADFAKVPNVSRELHSVQEVLKTDISLEAKKGNTSFEEIPQRVSRSTQSGRQDIMDFMTELEDLSADKIGDLGTGADQLVQDILEPLRKKINDYLGRDGLVMSYDNVRFFSLMGLACAVLFTVLLMYCGLTGGVLGSRDYDTPSTRSLMADCGGRTLMASVAFYFLCSLFVNLLLGLLYIIGSNSTVLCRSAMELTLIEKTVDDPSLFGFYPLSKTLLGDGDINVQLSNVIRGCGRDKTPWELLQLDKKFDLRNMTDYRDKIPPMDEIFRQLNSTISHVIVLTPDAEKNLNDSIDAGVHGIPFDKFSEQIEKPLVNDSLEQFSANLQALSFEARSASPSIADRLGFLATKLLIIQNDIVDTSHDLVTILKSKVELLEEKANNTVDSVQDVYTRLESLDLFLKTRALSLANEASHRYLNRILGWIDQYVDEAIRKNKEDRLKDGEVRTDVGKCAPMKNVYDATTSVVCENLLSALNALWLSLGAIAVFSVLSIILCVRLAKHYRRAERSSSSAKASTYGVPLTLFTSTSRPGRKTATPWRKVNKNSPVPSDLRSMRWV